MSDDMKMIRLASQVSYMAMEQAKVDDEYKAFFCAKSICQMMEQYRESGMSFENYAYAIGVNDLASVVGAWEIMDKHLKD